MLMPLFKAAVFAVATVLVIVGVADIIVALLDIAS